MKFIFAILIILLALFAEWQIIVYVIENTSCEKNGKTITCLIKPLTE